MSSIVELNRVEDDKNISDLLCPGGLRGGDLSQAAQLKLAPDTALMHVHLQNMSLMHSQEQRL